MMLIPQLKTLSLIFHKHLLSITFNIYLYHYYFTAAPPGFVAISYLLSWSGGKTYCRTNYVDLARATTITENNALQQIASVQGMSWIGLFRDVWMWLDGTIPMALMWNPGSPNNVDHDDNCASVNNSMFVDRQCNSLFSFFCHIRESFLIFGCCHNSFVRAVKHHACGKNKFPKKQFICLCFVFFCLLSLLQHIL